MPGTRGAPTVNGTPTYKNVALRWIDASGDKRSDSIQVPATATPAQIEAFAAAEQAGANSSLYAVEVSDVYNSTPDKSNALDAVKDSVFDNMVYLAKTAANLSKRGFLPSPVASVFAVGTDQPDPTSQVLADIFTAFLALVGAGYTIQSVRYTERREINEAVNV